MKNPKIIVIITALLFITLFIAGSFFYKSYTAKRLGFMARENAEVFVRKHSPSLGPDKAKVYLVEFLDPECESCAQFYPFVKKILAKFPGKIKLVIRYVPNHSSSVFAVRILEAARMQGKYWEALELLFRYVHEWGSHHNPQPNLIWTYLEEIGVDIKKIRQDMNSYSITELMKQDAEDAKKVGARMTPTFFINGKQLEDFGPEPLQSAIEAALEK